MNFAVIDLSNTISATDLTKYAAAQQRQLREHYASCYDGNGIADQVRAVSTSEPLRPDEVAVYLHPKATQQDALGVHAQNKTGMPFCDVFLDLVKESGDTWTATASHEVLETRNDPRLRSCVELDDGSIWDHEICDRCEASSYQIDGVTLSNFNTPQCFEPTGTTHEKYDWLGLSTSPNQVLEDGYAQKYDPRHGWKMVGAMRSYRAALAAAGLSRNARRKVRDPGFATAPVA